jgi:hypothetical protein
MRLISLKITARGAAGWESPELMFGTRTTSLFAPNGSGKTPLVHAIAYCLGFDSKFRDDIRDHCQAAVLTFLHAGKNVAVRRDFAREFHVTVNDGESEREFFSEGEYSKAMFADLGLRPPGLVGSNRQMTLPYLSTVLPVFYVRQDGGYNEAYRAPATFIADQFVEMVRFLFGLSPRRSYDVQRELLQARELLEGIQRRLVFQEKVVADLTSQVGTSFGEADLLRSRAAAVQRDLDELRESANAIGAAGSVLQELLQSKERQIRSLRQQESDLHARLTGIDSIRSEIEGEIQTLSLNEESRRAFESFFEICARPDCSLFLSSSQSYAKNLMYLKDQIKDIEANSSRAEAQLEWLRSRLTEEEHERQQIAAKMNESAGPASSRQLVSAVQSLMRELLETQQRLAMSDRLSDARNKMLNIQEERNKTQDRIAALSNNSRADLEFNKLRMRVRDLTIKWMDILNTPNVSRDVEMDLDFKFKFGGESVDVFTGSTRSRLILSIHAAIFEEYLVSDERPFRFLILDTPKQQELDTSDLSRFLSSIQEVCSERNAQVLISATEYHHPIDPEVDAEWLPQYPGELHPMYLGKPAHG